MTAALELSPELQAAIDAVVEAKVKAQLALVPAESSEGFTVRELCLSMLPASIRRRASERRQSDAARGDRSAIDREGLSTIPATVRSREWKRRQAAAKKAAIDRQRMYLHSTAYEKHAGARGPLAADVAAIADRAEARRNYELARVYAAIREGLREGSKGKIRLPRIWAKTASEKEDARKLLENFGLQQIKATAVSLGENPIWPTAEYSRPTVSLVLFRLEAWKAGTLPPKRTDSRRLTGEQIEQRDQKRARAAAAPAPTKPATVVDPALRGPAERGPETRTVPSPGTPETASGVSEVGKNPGEAVSPVSTPEGPRGTIRPLPAGPLQLAEPSPSSSPEAIAVLELVNSTAARCRAFKRRGGAP
jgi:hypothetical protein